MPEGLGISDLPAMGDWEARAASRWTSLRLFNAYRLIVATLFLLALFAYPLAFTQFSADARDLYVATSVGYLIAAAVAPILSRRYRQRFNPLLTGLVIGDIFAQTLLMHACGGLRSGFGAMLLVTLAAAGLVGRGRLVIFYAACAALAVLFEQFYGLLLGTSDLGGFIEAGVLSIGFFMTAASARLLARRVITNEELALRRGVQLANQVRISQRAIEEVQDGVLLVGVDGNILQRNPRAEEFFGLGHASDSALAAHSAELDAAFRGWRLGGAVPELVFRVAATGYLVRARFVATGSSGGEALVFLEDMGRVHAQVQQMKLAALGRLTGNIAHEIRNPLSAINHAAELLREDAEGSTQQRLVAIVLDNAQRLERIVREVLEVGRRDRANPEVIALSPFLEHFVEEFAAARDIRAEIVAVEPSGDQVIAFDRLHLHQVLWNLLVNAVRHSRREAGSVRVWARSVVDAGLIELHVADDGEGVDESVRGQVFEPFFTTHHEGTGLGLYVARELCEANGARLELLDNAPGGHFRITGRIHGGSHED